MRTDDQRLAQLGELAVRLKDFDAFGTLAGTLELRRNA